MLEGSGYLDHPNFRTAGHHDSAARLADYDHDGIAAGVIFHGSMNLEPIPFVASALGKPKPTGDRGAGGSRPVDLQPLARRLRRRRAAPAHRARVPPDVGRRRRGRRGGVGARSGTARRELPCHARRRAAAVQPTHLGTALGRRAKTSACRSSPTSAAAPTRVTRGWNQWRSCSWSRRCSRVRAVWWLIFAGVFERHSGLKLVITETPGNWFPPTATELDTLHAFYDSKRDEPLNQALLEQVPRRPSEYMANNVFFGASFASPYEVEQAMLHGLGVAVALGIRLSRTSRARSCSQTDARLRRSPGSRCGTRSATSRRQRPSGWSAGTRSRCTTSTPPRCATIAREIDAPTLDELATPIDAVPDAGSVTAFRSGAGGWS